MACVILPSRPANIKLELVDYWVPAEELRPACCLSQWLIPGSTREPERFMAENQMTATNHLSTWIAISCHLSSCHNPVDRLSTCLLPSLLLCHSFQILFNSCYLQMSSFHFCEDLHMLPGLVMVSSPSTLVDHSDSFIITEQLIHASEDWNDILLASWPHLSSYDLHSFR